MQMCSQVWGPNVRVTVMMCLMVSETQIQILTTDQLKKFHKLPDTLGNILCTNAFLFGEGTDLTTNFEKEVSVTKG